MVLEDLPVPGSPTTSENSREKAYCACSRCEWRLFALFVSRLLFLSSSALWETVRYRLKYCLKGPLNPKQPTHQVTHQVIFVRDVESKTGKWRTTPTKRLFTDITSDNVTSFSLSCRLAWFRECMKTPNGIVYF